MVRLLTTQPRPLPSYFSLASSPGPSQILSHSRVEKSGEDLGSKLRHGPEMVDSVSTNRVHVTYWPSPPFPVRDVVLIPGLLPIFLHGSEIKTGRGLGTRLAFPCSTTTPRLLQIFIICRFLSSASDNYWRGLERSTLKHNYMKLL